MGTSLQIRGRTTPNGANYSVTLQDLTSRYTARSPFTQDDTILFYMSNLDPNTVHSFSIVNEGGSLELGVNGAVAFAAGSPNPADSSPGSTMSSSPSVTPVGASSSGSALSTGTIAALALAGILGFLLLTGTLFYLFVYRPRRKQGRYSPRHARQDSQSGAVLDIGPQNSRRDASEYWRWKQEVEGQHQGKDLGMGLVFSHTPSPKEKRLSSLDLDSAEDDDERSARSFSFTPSPNNRSADASNKSGSLRSWLSGKHKKSSSSSTPSYTIELPPLQAQNMARSASEPSPTHLQPRSSFSGITSLSYVSSSSSGPSNNRFSFNPHETSSSPNLHGRTDSNGLLLLNDELARQPDDNDSGYQPTLSTQQAPQVFVQEVASSYDDSERGSTRPQGLARSLSARTGSDADRGSVRTYDDSVSFLGASTARAAIRGLSPRTSEATFATFGIGRRGDERTSVQLERLEESTAPQPPPLQKEPSRERLVSDTTLRPETQGRYIDVRTGSPFRVDLEQRPSVQHRRGHSTGSVAGPRPAARLSVRFEEANVAGPSGQRESVAGGIKPLPLPPKTAFRLTPQPPTTMSSPEPDSPSFLDFGAGSSNASQKTGSNDQPGSPQSVYPPSTLTHPLGGQSRWSSTSPSSHEHLAQDSTDDAQSRISATTSPSYHFPFPVSLPASPHHPEGHKPSPPNSPSGAGSRNILGRLTSESNPISPVESVPMSISDQYFRNSDSDDSPSSRTAPRLPPHPPLPSVPPTPTQPLTDTTSSTTTPRPGYVVSRLTGPSGASGTTPTSATRTPTFPPPTAIFSRHNRSLSSDLLLSPIGRRPLGPRDSKH
ncbi:hypothetical protein VNI00_007445 [Paramarasmius palmivorus]|uniref:Uncharacterized protein n=1 Tax=Paramarasmius palmivorus TaxID=297713 RepID=A0AAW0D686_9AGAR